MSDNISNSFIDDQVYTLFKDWKYTEELIVYRCAFENSLFIKVVAESDNEHEFEISLKDLKFYRDIYKKGIKTLLLFFSGSKVYYDFLNVLDVDEDKIMAYIRKEDMREIDFNNREHGETL